VILPEPVCLRIRRADNTWPAWLLARYRVAPDHPAKLRLWRWLYTLTGRPEVCVRYAGRARLRLDLEDLVQFAIAQDGFYEPEVWDALAAFASGDEVVWDVGGHVGGMAIADRLRGRVDRGGRSAR